MINYNQDMNGGEMVKKSTAKTVSVDALDVKAISEKMERLPRDKLMYVAGAVTALAAAEAKPAEAEAKPAERPA